MHSDEFLMRLGKTIVETAIQSGLSLTIEINDLSDKFYRNFAGIYLSMPLLCLFLGAPIDLDNPFGNLEELKPLKKKLDELALQLPESTMIKDSTEEQKLIIPIIKMASKGLRTEEIFDHLRLKDHVIINSPIGRDNSPEAKALLSSMKKTTLLKILRAATKGKNTYTSPLRVRDRIRIELGFILPTEILIRLYTDKFSNNKTQSKEFSESLDQIKQITKDIFDNLKAENDYKSYHTQYILQSCIPLMVMVISQLKLTNINLPGMPSLPGTLGTFLKSLITLNLQNSEHAKMISGKAIEFHNSLGDFFNDDYLEQIKQVDQKNCLVKKLLELVENKFQVEIHTYCSSQYTAASSTRHQINTRHLSQDQKKQLLNILDKLFKRNDEDKSVGINSDDTRIAIYANKIDATAAQDAIQILEKLPTPISSKPKTADASSRSSSSLEIAKDSNQKIEDFFQAIKNIFPAIDYIKTDSTTPISSTTTHRLMLKNLTEEEKTTLVNLITSIAINSSKVTVARDNSQIAIYAKNIDIEKLSNINNLNSLPKEKIPSHAIVPGLN